MKFKLHFYDDNGVRHRLVKNNPSVNSYNWLFFPGGAGADSIYYCDLIKNIDLPGNFWLIDFPGNGDNFSNSINSDYDFDLWESYFVPFVKKFDNPILIGHSFGGMFPLLFPYLENLLKGFVVLSSAPKLWLNEADQYTKENNILINIESRTRFVNNPTQASFKEELLANLPRHFPEKSRKKGRELFEKLPFNYKAMLWWIKKVRNINFDAKWIPEKVPTLVIGGTNDFIVPCSIFEKDQRFRRNNVQIKTLQDAGHFPWFDQMDVMLIALKSFFSRVQENESFG